MRVVIYRNFGILIGFMVFFCGTHLLTTEYITAAKSKGEVLVFRRSHISQLKKKAKNPKDLEAAITTEKNGNKGVDEDAVAAIQRQTSIFHWEDVVYDIKIKKEPRRLLDHIDGWVEPGTLTALMVRLVSSDSCWGLVSNCYVGSGCIWCREDYSFGCFGKPCDHGCRVG